MVAGENIHAESLWNSASDIGTLVTWLYRYCVQNWRWRSARGIAHDACQIPPPARDPPCQDYERAEGNCVLGIGTIMDSIRRFVLSMMDMYDAE
jgi:hypothetical protein